MCLNKIPSLLPYFTPLKTSHTDTYTYADPYIQGTALTNTPPLPPIIRPDRIQLYTLDNTPLFYQHMDDPLIPHLKIIHKYPDAFPALRIDRGAIRFVLSGAALMVPGLTSAGGRLPPQDSACKPGDVVVIKAEGKEEVCMVGMLEVGTEEMKEKKKGVAIAAGHFLGDGLWKLEI